MQDSGKKSADAVDLDLLRRAYESNEERAKRDPAFAALKKLSEVCGNVNISGARQAKKNFMKERKMSPRQFRKYRKGLKQVIKDAIRKAEEAAALVVPDEPLPVI